MATEHRQVFVELERLIEGDTDLAYVGLDRIEGYWRCRDGWTTHQQPYTKISESEMLAAVGMSHERAHTFRSLLRQVGALAVEKGDGYVRFPMEISGTLVTGATWSLFHGTSLPADAELVGEITYQHISQPGEKYLYERINGDWYVEYVAQ